MQINQHLTAPAVLRRHSKPQPGAPAISPTSGEDRRTEAVLLAVIAVALLVLAWAWAVLDAAFADIGDAPPSIDAAHATAAATTAKLSAADLARKQVFDERRQRLQSRQSQL